MLKRPPALRHQREAVRSYELPQEPPHGIEPASCMLLAYADRPWHGMLVLPDRNAQVTPHVNR